MPTVTFQEILKRLHSFWESQGCIIQQGYDLEVGAGTFNPTTFLRCLGPEPYKAAYVEPCRRPTDGRYGTNPNRTQHYFQYQVILKPSPPNIQELYLKSLEAIGFNLEEHDIRFVHDDWESPTLGAWGLGWEVWMDGMEVTQFTYFQALGGVELSPITGEITYGTERLAMYLQKVNTFFDLKWNDTLTYGDIYHQNEVEWSHYNFHHASSEMWYRHFEDYENEARKLITAGFPIPAYDFVIKASHAFNMLDARGVISVTERTGYIARIRDLAKLIAESYILSREKQGFPLLRYNPAASPSPEIPPLTMLKNTEKEDFILEIGSEELPATFVKIGSQNLKKQIEFLLHKEELPFEEIRVYATPRRIAVEVKGLAVKKNQKKIEKKGPPLEQIYQENGALTKTGEGFFRSLNISPPNLSSILDNQCDQLEIRIIKNVRYLFGFLQEEERFTAAILQEQLPYIILNLDFPKKMRWGDVKITYARPLRWILSLFGNTVIPFQVGPIVSDRLTFGHRQLAPSFISISHPREYLDKLRKQWVMADPEERKKNIEEQIAQLETEHSWKIIEKEKVIPQVLNLVEYPFLTASSFNSEFLKAPKEVLISEMVEHQKYFPVTSLEGALVPYFIITCNTRPTQQIREGNQKVLSARLSDGVFLYQEDLKAGMDSFNEKLKKILFQKSLGTIFDKVERIKKHAKYLQAQLLISSPAHVLRAAQLSKADLASGMVYEFPDLQGIIGSYYAKAEGEPQEVFQAIEEQWLPRNESDRLPSTSTGTILSLADKLDNLIGCFLAGLKPTSSSDPYALRRQALGVMKILLQGQHSFSLKNALSNCLEHFSLKETINKKELLDEIYTFISNRIPSIFLDQHFQKDEIEATLSKGCDDIFDAFCKIEALHAFRKESPEQFNSLVEVYKRAKGQIENHPSSDFEEKILQEPAEQELIQILKKQKNAFLHSIEEKNYSASYELIAGLQKPLANLFEEVKILADDLKIRENRLSLLKNIFDLFGRLVDFSKIQSISK